MNLAEEYIDKVDSGELLSCKWVRLAVERHLSFFDRDDLYFDRKTAESVLNIFSHFRHTAGQYAGKRFQLLPWQAFCLWVIYGWKEKSTEKRIFTSAYIEVAKKNGKTEFAAGNALIGTIFTTMQGVDIFSAANKLDQACLCWNAGVKMAEYLKNDFAELDDKLIIHKSFNNRKVRYTKTSNTFVPIAADAKTLDGPKPYVTVIDEYHEAKDDAVLKNITSGQVMFDDPMLMIITTAGFNVGGPCHKRRQKICEILEGKVHNDGMFGIIFTLDEDDDWEDENLWIKANPSIGITPTWKGIRQEYQNAITEGEESIINFKTKNLNKWMKQSKVWIKDKVWQKKFSFVNPDKLKGRKCWAGLDAASVKDLSCFTLFFPKEPGEDQHTILQWYWVPEDTARHRSKEDKVPYLQWIADEWILATPGNVTDYEFIQSEIVDLAQDYDIVSLGYDPWNTHQMATNLYNLYSIEVKKFRQTTANFNEPIKWIERNALRGKINHGGNPVLRWMLGNVELIRDTNGNRKFDKRKSREKIDGMVSLGMAIGEYLDGEKQEKTPGIYIGKQ